MRISNYQQTDLEWDLTADPGRLSTQAMEAIQPSKMASALDLLDIAMGYILERVDRDTLMADFASASSKSLDRPRSHLRESKATFAEAFDDLLLSHLLNSVVELDKGEDEDADKLTTRAAMSFDVLSRDWYSWALDQAERPDTPAGAEI